MSVREMGRFLTTLKGWRRTYHLFLLPLETPFAGQQKTPANFEEAKKYKLPWEGLDYGKTVEEVAETPEGLRFIWEMSAILSNTYRKPKKQVEVSDALRIFMSDPEVRHLIDTKILPPKRAYEGKYLNLVLRELNKGNLDNAAEFIALDICTGDESKWPMPETMEAEDRVVFYHPRSIIMDRIEGMVEAPQIRKSRTNEI